MPIVIKAVKEEQFKSWLKEAKVKFATHDLNQSKFVMLKNN